MTRPFPKRLLISAGVVGLVVLAFYIRMGPQEMASVQSEDMEVTLFYRRSEQWLHAVTGGGGIWCEVKTPHSSYAGWITGDSFDLIDDLDVEAELASSRSVLVNITKSGTTWRLQISVDQGSICIRELGE